MEKNAFYCFWVVLAAILAILILGAIHMFITYSVKMAELGYQQEVVVGRECPVWHKIGGN